ncbi:MULTISPECIES: McrB family protein [Alistipes]|uniref:McrB family protein n=1 Tax=Alistipes TaxID=239759 RepID=UPI001B370B36|nr:MULTISPECIES: AAA family ATPase [Alistipes]MBQ4902689.1 AAA family ATPase [Alistipes sp. Marseille-P2263]MCI2258446.1 AAA family ATPase [Alistipes dispar]
MKKTLAYYCERINRDDTWAQSYKHFVPLFIQEAKTKTRWEDWDKDVFWEFFERPNDQCVSSLQQGYFSRDERVELKNHWNEISPLLKVIADNQDVPQWNAYDRLANVIRQYTKKNMRAAVCRLAAALQPQLLCTIVNDTKLCKLYKLMGKYVSEEIPLCKGSLFQKSRVMCRLFQSNLKDGNPMEIATYPWKILQLFESMEKNNNNMGDNIKEKRTLLEEVHNLVFTGAPGTGKTYLAKQLAKQMIGVETDDALDKSGQFAFVQFHPSYDYTDFVEGLRPTPPDTSENIGFELKDGVFKEFCEKARKNLEDSQKDDEALSFEQQIEDKYNQLIDAIQNDEINELCLKTGKKAVIARVSKSNNISFKRRVDEEPSTNGVSLPRLKRLAAKYKAAEDLENLKNINQGIRDVIGGCNATWYWAILHHLYKTYGDVTDNVTANKVDRKNYVFVIDEINRGEISKIFGELFFSIDPSYRGEKGAVYTQYANMHETDEKFYVPENVYIIGTMNDIDRSVESFDFAMRRRFVWQEITAEKSAENMNLSKECKDKMKSLNDKISGIEGLGSSYHIGGAYFLDEDGAPIKDFEETWNLRLEPLLREYLRGMPNADNNLDELREAYENAVNN